ncbi:MAG: T9SS type A sorting domain-containing protein [Bacteroidales bacterium]|nr:T9SS type A sorting domain-containing protein [Bacteroidales bacterium]
MRRILVHVIFFAFLCFNYHTFAQVKTQDERAFEVLKERGEVFFSFMLPPAYSLVWLSNRLSVDRIKDDTVFAYANKQEFEEFLKLKTGYTLHTPVSLIERKSLPFKTTLDEGWQSYPSYSQYIAMMENFEATHPQICRIVDIGLSIGGKRIMAVKISDNVQDEEAEPGVFYSSTMHGDEPSGYILMLRFIDHLLSNYETDEKISFLINNAAVYINPLANPDGLYFMSDTSVIGAKRNNLNNIDLNRDFPDAENGSKAVMQPETRCMVDFMAEKKFVLSANFHGGAEVVNYPWDRWERRHADNQWYIRISREYADTAHKYAGEGYMTDLENGITNGFDWYQVSHGRQDFVNYYLHGREATIELSRDKIPSGPELQILWDYNIKSLVNYLMNCFTGINGTVRGSDTGNPLKAGVFIDDYDRDNSHVYSDSATGIFYRLLSGGNYPLTVSAFGYLPVHLEVEVPESGFAGVNIELVPSGYEIITYPNPFTDNFKIFFSEPITDEIDIVLSDLTGKVFFNKRFNLTGPENFELETSHLSNGVYLISFTSGGLTKILKVIKAPID